MKIRFGPGVRAVVLLLTVATVLSGCAGKAKDCKAEDKNCVNPADTVTPTVDANTGAIYGVVLDDAGLPIQGVDVQVRELPDRGVETTNDVGEFAFSNVDPGPYTLDLSKLGYTAKSAQVEVKVGEAPLIEYSLEAIAPVVPYMDPQEQVGRMWLSAGWTAADCAVQGVTCNAISFGMEGYENEHYFSVTDSRDNRVETIVAELKWPGQNAACQSDFQFDVLAPGIERDPDTGGVNPGDPKQFRGEAYTSPITVRIDRALLTERGLVDDAQGTSSIEGDDWTTRVFARQGGTSDSTTADVGCSYDQPFTVYFTVFYGEPAPADFSRTGDA